MEYFFQRVDKRSLTPEHVAMIERSDKWETSEQKEDIFRMISEDLAQVWIYEDAELNKGVVVTAIMGDVNGKKELCLWRFIGSGLIKNFNLIISELDSFARAEDCTSIYALTVRPGIVRTSSKWFDLSSVQDNVYILERVV